MMRWFCVALHTWGIALRGRYYDATFCFHFSHMKIEKLLVYRRESTAIAFLNNTDGYSESENFPVFSFLLSIGIAHIKWVLSPKLSCYWSMHYVRIGEFSRRNALQDTRSCLGHYGRIPARFKVKQNIGLSNEREWITLLHHLERRYGPHGWPL